MVEKDEYYIAMNQLEPDLPLSDINLLFNIIDQDQNGNISFLEFLAAMIDPRDVDIQEMNQVSSPID